MKWHDNAAALLGKTGDAGAAPARLLLDVLLPAAPTFVALVGECLACAAGAGPHPEASAADLDRAAEALGLLTAELGAVLLQAGDLIDLPERASRVVARALSADTRCRAAALRLGRLAGASDRLASQVRRGMAGRDMATVAEAVRLAAGSAGAADLVEELTDGGKTPDEVRQRFDAFTGAARLYGAGDFAGAAKGWEELAAACPGSPAVAEAQAAAEAAAGDRPAAQRSLARAHGGRPQIPEAGHAPPAPQNAEEGPPGEWFVGDLGKPEFGFDRSEFGPPDEVPPGRIYQLRVSRAAVDSQLTGLQRWRGSPVLHALVMAGCGRLTDAALARLQGLTGLRVLDLSFWDHLTDAGLAEVGELKDLRVLNLTRADQVTDEGLAHLTGLGALRALDLTKCERVTDAGLAHVSRLGALRYLELSFCPEVTDVGLAHVARLSRLEGLSLDACPFITDDGLAKLCVLSELRTLSLGRCNGVTEIGVEALAAALPDCRFLG